MIPQTELQDTGVDCLVIAARLLGTAADAGQIRHQFGVSGHTLTTPDLIRAAKSLGLRAKEHDLGWDTLLKTQPPIIATTRDGRYFLIARLAADKVLAHFPASLHR